MHTRSRFVLGVAVVGAVVLSACSGTGPPPDGSGVRPPAPAAAAAAPSLGEVPLPNEGERSTAPDVSDWTTSTVTQQPWLLEPCGPTAYPTDAARTSFRTVSRSGPQSEAARQLAVYPSPEHAAETVTGFRRVIEACGTGGRAGGGAARWDTRYLPDLGDEGFVAAGTVAGPGYAPNGDRIAVTRVGSAVFLASVHGRYATTKLDDGVGEVRRVAEQFLGSVGR